MRLFLLQSTERVAARAEAWRYCRCVRRGPRLVPSIQRHWLACVDMASAMRWHTHTMTTNMSQLFIPPRGRPRPASLDLCSMQQCHPPDGSTGCAWQWRQRPCCGHPVPPSTQVGSMGVAKWGPFPHLHAVTGGAEDMEVADLHSAMLRALPAESAAPCGNPRTFGTVPRLLRAFAAAGFRDITARLHSIPRIPPPPPPPTTLPSSSSIPPIGGTGTILFTSDTYERLSSASTVL